MLIFKYNLDDKEFNSNIFSMFDFYTAVGAFDEFTREGKDICQFRMNDGENTKLREMLIKNLSKKKSGFTEKYINTQASMDWLCYSAKTDNSVPNGELYVDEGPYILD